MRQNTGHAPTRVSDSPDTPVLSRDASLPHPQTCQASGCQSEPAWALSYSSGLLVEGSFLCCLCRELFGAEAPRYVQLVAAQPVSWFLLGGDRLPALLAHDVAVNP